MVSIQVPTRSYLEHTLDIMNKILSKTFIYWDFPVSCPIYLAHVLSSVEEMADSNETVCVLL